MNEVNCTTNLMRIEQRYNALRLFNPMVRIMLNTY